MVATKVNKSAGHISQAKAIAKKQDALLQTLNPEAQKHVHQVKAWFAKADRDALTTRYDLGREINALYHDNVKNGTGHFGLRFITCLCDAFGWDKGVVYGALAVAKSFTQKQITSLCDRPMPNGRLLSFSHLRALTKVPTDEMRESLLNKAIAQCWTCEELQDAIIQHMTGQKKEDTRGRPFKAPRDLRGLLHQQEHSADEFVRRSTEVWEKPQFSLIRQVKKLSDKEVTEAQIETLKKHAAAMRQLVKKASVQAEEAERAAELLQNKLKTLGETHEPAKHVNGAAGKTAESVGAG